MENSEPITHRNPPTQPLVPDLSYSPVNPVSEEKPAPARRKPLLSPDDNTPSKTNPTSASPNPSTPSATSYIVKTARPTNQRRGKPVLKLIGLVFLCNILLIGASATWYYNFINDQFEKRLTQHPTRQTQPNPNPDTTSTQNTPTTPTADQTDSQEKITDLQSQLLALQKRLTETELTTKTLANTLNKTTATQNTIPIATPINPTNTNTNPQTPVTEDLLLLKERNRLTSYADEAIATATREPYERLWNSLEDPRLATLIHATRAEILRVQNYYLSGSRLDRFDIPVADYFPEADALRDSQLNDEQLIRLLSNPDHPWQVRLKAANLLGLRRSTTVGDALVKAVQTDQNLDVVKEATFSFEQLTGFRAQLFETDALAAWWKQYNETPPNNTNPPTPPADTESAEKPATTDAEKDTKASDNNKTTTPAKPTQSKTTNKKTNQPPEPPLPELLVPKEAP